MDLKLHPEAAARFDALARELFGKLREVSPESLRQRRPGFEPDTFVAASFTEKDIVGEIQQLGTVNLYSGEVAELVFHEGERAFKLIGEACQDFEQLVTRLSQIEPLSRFVTRTTIRSTTIDWISARLRQPATANMIAYLSDQIGPRVSATIAVIPVAFLHVESPLPFGRVTFRHLNAPFFDSLSAWRDRIPDEDGKQGFDRWLLDYRRKLQGYAAVYVEVEGEPDFVNERALQEATHAVAMLRILAPESLYPEARSFVAPVDLQPPPTYDVWLFDPGQSIPKQRHRGPHPPTPIPWTLSDNTMRQIRANFAFDDLSTLARGQGLSPFEKTLEECILLFSKATGTASPAEKLVFVSVSLETLLVRNSNEFIQQSVGDRFAFLLTHEPTKRKELVALFKSCYDLRSSFLHHGRSPSDLNVLREFLHHAWSLLMRLLKHRSEFQTKAHLLDYADSIKYS